jgi:hypothetical protein
LAALKPLTQPTNAMVDAPGRLQEGGTRDDSSGDGALGVTLLARGDE